jgi:hypothetical protein
MTHEVTYRIVELLDRRLCQVIYEVWGANQATGYQWLVAECNTRAEARDVVKRHQSMEAKT